jgi:hypothetical protein
MKVVLYLIIMKAWKNYSTNLNYDSDNVSYLDFNPIKITEEIDLTKRTFEDDSSCTELKCETFKSSPTNCHIQVFEEEELDHLYSPSSMSSGSLCVEIEPPTGKSNPKNCHIQVSEEELDHLYSPSSMSSGSFCVEIEPPTCKAIIGNVFLKSLILAPSPID